MGSNQLAITLQRIISKSSTGDTAACGNGGGRSVLLTSNRHTLPILTYINIRKQMYLDIKGALLEWLNTWML